MKLRLILCCLLLFISSIWAKDDVRKASEALIKRVVPEKAALFKVETIQTKEGKDFFDIESKNNKIILRGNNGVSVASALYHYLKYYCNTHISWNGDNLNLPSRLPEVPEKIVCPTVFDHRVYLNYCTVSYTMAW